MMVLASFFEITFCISGQSDVSLRELLPSSRISTEAPVSIGVIPVKSTSIGGVSELATMTCVGSEMRMCGIVRRSTPRYREGRNIDCSLCNYSSVYKKIIQINKIPVFTP